jgi:hypothetical protein
LNHKRYPSFLARHGNSTHFQIAIGESIESFVTPKNESQLMSQLKSSRKFLLFHSRNRTHVFLRNDIVQQDIFASYVLAKIGIVVKQNIADGKNLEYYKQLLANEKEYDEFLANFLNLLSIEGWNIDQYLLGAKEWRYLMQS